MFNMAKHGQDNYTIHLQKCPRIDCESQMLHKKSKTKSPGDSLWRCEAPQKPNETEKKKKRKKIRRRCSLQILSAFQCDCYYYIHDDNNNKHTEDRTATVVQLVCLEHPLTSEIASGHRN